MDGERDRWLQRPHDRDALRSAIRLVRRRLEVPFAFGGEVDDDDAMRLSELDGATTRGLRDLLVRPGAGLGGRVIESQRPAGVRDYANARTITHDYDRPVLAERIRSIVAAPVTVRGRVRAVLYASVRGGATLGERAADRLVDIARQLGAEFALRDEVDRRVRLIAADYAERQSPVLGTDAREEIRDLQGELRRIAQAVDDPGLRDQLRQASERLAGLGQPRPDAATGSQNDGLGTVGPGAVGPQLSPRELDVLAQVALGCGNAEIARRLSLRPETVKAYLRSATGKLEVHNRNEAVVAARRLGLLALPSQARLATRPAPGRDISPHAAPARSGQTNECDALPKLLGTAPLSLNGSLVRMGRKGLVDTRRTAGQGTRRAWGG